MEKMLTVFSRGSKPHRSHDDPSDPLEVISIRLKDAQDRRIDSIHMHEDGTSKKKTAHR